MELKKKQQKTRTPNPAGSRVCTAASTKVDIGLKIFITFDTLGTSNVTGQTISI